MGVLDWLFIVLSLSFCRFLSLFPPPSSYTNTQQRTHANTMSRAASSLWTPSLALSLMDTESCTESLHRVSRRHSSYRFESWTLRKGARLLVMPSKQKKSQRADVARKSDAGINPREHQPLATSAQVSAVNSEAEKRSYRNAEEANLQVGRPTEQVFRLKGELGKKDESDKRTQEQMQNTLSQVQRNSFLHLPLPS